MNSLQNWNIQVHAETGECFSFSRLHLVNTCYDTKLVREMAKHNIHKIPQIHEVDDLENNPKTSVIMCDNNIFPS